MTYYRNFDKSYKTAGAINGIETSYSCGAPDFIPDLFVGFVFYNLQFYAQHLVDNFVCPSFHFSLSM